MITIENMIKEGSITAERALRMGYRWSAYVVGGDALDETCRVEYSE